MNPRAVLAPMTKAMNAGVAVLARVPWIGPQLGRNLAQITYVGRRSGRTISTYVGFRRAGDEIIIDVHTPDWKTWWRNFLSDGGPVTLELHGTERTGHAVAHRDDNGRVTVHVHLDHHD